MPKNTQYIYWLDSVDSGDEYRLGKTAVALADLAKYGVSIPKGYCLSHIALEEVIVSNQLDEKIGPLLEEIDFGDERSVDRVAQQIQKLIRRAEVPYEISLDVARSYNSLVGDNLVRLTLSSQPSQIAPSFYHQLELSPLRVKGDANLIDLVREAWSLLYSAQNLRYRHSQKKPLYSHQMSLIVQEELNADVSGLLFTADPFNKHKQTITIEAVWGLSDQLLQGSVTPDRYIVDRATLDLLHGETVPQHSYLTIHKHKTSAGKVPSNLRNEAKLDSSQIKQLTELAKTIHGHHYFPQQIHWSLEGKTIHVLKSSDYQIDVPTIEPQTNLVSTQNLDVLLQGTPVFQGLVSGPVKIVNSNRDLDRIKKDEIVVTASITPEIIVASRKARGIITDHGGVTSHGSILARELHIPCVVGTGKATKVLKNGMVVTLNGTSGILHLGGLKRSFLPTLKEIVPAKELDPDLKTATKMLLYASPETDIAKVGLMSYDALILSPQTSTLDQLEIASKSMGQRTVVLSPSLTVSSSSNWLQSQVSQPVDLKAITNFLRKQKKQGTGQTALLLDTHTSVAECVKAKKRFVSRGLRFKSFPLWLEVSKPAVIMDLASWFELEPATIVIDVATLDRYATGQVGLKSHKMHPGVWRLLEEAIEIAKQHQIETAVRLPDELVNQTVLVDLVRIGVHQVITHQANPQLLRHFLHQAEYQKLHHPVTK